jgi:hypothetical protein
LEGAHFNFLPVEGLVAENGGFSFVGLLEVWLGFVCASGDSVI